MSRPKVLVLVGATATGKSAVAARLAEACGLEVVSMDSMQVYRGIPVVSAQPEPELLKRAPHHLLEIADPGAHFDTAMYLDACRAAIADIHARGRAALLAGGTPMYYRSLVHGLSALPTSDEGLRAQLIADQEREGPGHLHRRLSEVDPASALRLHPNDTRRLVRALEVHALSGRPQSVLFAEPKVPLIEHFLAAGIAAPRDVLYPRIDARVEAMWAAGLVDEIRRLRSRLPPGRHTVQQAIGYPQVAAFLDGEHDEAEAKRLVQRDTRRFARRQILQFQAETTVNWTPEAAFPDVEALVEWTTTAWKDASR